jgi:hypothetical protein
MDPDNPIVTLCARGMEAEGRDRPLEAKALFEQAWEQATDDYEACIAAHYVARHQATDEDNLRWNQEALARADRVADPRVRGFYPSLLLNLGHAFELTGRRDEARRQYTLAVARTGDLPEGPYGDLVREGLGRALARVGLHRNQLGLPNAPPPPDAGSPP